LAVTNQSLSRGEMVEGGGLEIKNSPITNNKTPTHAKVNNSQPVTLPHTPDGKQRW